MSTGKSIAKPLFTSCAAVSALLAVITVNAQSTAAKVQESPQTNPGVYSGRLEVNYPTPYAPATVEQIRASLERVHHYLEQASPVQAIDADSGERVTDLSRLPTHVALARTDLLILSYEWGVTYSGMLLAAKATGDKRYTEYTDARVSALALLANHAKAHPVQAGSSGTSQGLSLRSMLAPRALDDSGSMCAALIKAEQAGLGHKSLRPWIDNYLQFVSSRQFRLSDGTLARNRPLPNSLWLDDLYMSVPCLAQAGKLTGERKYFDDAAKQILQFADRMFVKDHQLFRHGWVQEMQFHPTFHWARANGWAIMAMAELLDVMPQDHPDRDRILALFRNHAEGLMATQGHAGLWHQLLDRRESYEETSASAMFVFGIARGINRGWLDPLAFGPTASLGWNAVARQINEKGQVEGTCVGTGMAWDPMFYMYRPVHVLAAHGYGPVFLAGAEMIELRNKFGDRIAMHDGGVHFGKALEN
ncbi:MAG: glycoside hydrolase family 105 protein [Povalibacter sp.]